MAKAKPCVGCGGDKAPVRGALYCEVCRASTASAVAARAAQTKAERRNATANEHRAAQGQPLRMSKKMTPEGMKWCARCQRFLPIDKFKQRGNGARAPYCPPCQRSYHHERHVQTKFGLAPGQYGAMLVEQGGRCAICGNQPRKYRLAVDHDHKTGRVRGLLCGRCNKDLLGAAHDDIEILRRAVNYLAAPPAAVHTVVPQERRDDDAIESALQRLRREQLNAAATFGVLFVKRPRLGWVAVMDIDQFCTIWREATA